MKTLSGALALASLLGLIARGFAEPPGPAANETMNQLSRSAGQELAVSIKGLNDLRDQIAIEKLPLAQELTASEEKLAQLRGGVARASPPMPARWKSPPSGPR